MNFAINHIQHIGIPVTDLENSKAFYEKLGFKDVMSASFDHEKEKGKVAMMQLKQIIIEIYQFPEAELANIRNRQDGHVDHVAFDVDDIDQAFIELKAAGFKVIENEPVFLQFWENGCRYFNVLGPNGERLEFNQII